MKVCVKNKLDSSISKVKEPKVGALPSKLSAKGNAKSGEELKKEEDKETTKKKSKARLCKFETLSRVGVSGFKSGVISEV